MSLEGKKLIRIDYFQNWLLKVIEKKESFIHHFKGQAGMRSKETSEDLISLVLVTLLDSQTI